MPTNKKLWWIGVVVGILMIVGPSIVSLFNVSVSTMVRDDLSAIGVVVAIVSLIFYLCVK